jgi:hypothetical protein
MGVEVFRAPLYRRFLADRLTCGYLLAILFRVTVVILPFFLAYTSEGFWMKTNTYREMPRISFQYQSMISAGVKSTSGNAIQKVAYSLKPENLALVETTQRRIPKMKYWADDANQDGFPEVLHIDVDLPLKDTEAVHNVEAVFIFRMELSVRAKVFLEAPVIVQHESPFPGESLHTNGVLTLVQRAPVSVRGGFKEPYSASPLLGSTLKTSANIDIPHLSVTDLGMPTLIDRIQARNYTTYLHNTLSSWSPRPEGSVPINIESGSSRPFKLRLTVQVPEQTVLYLPSLSEMLKFAFVQYLSMAVIVYILCWYAVEFVFAYQVVETTSRMDTQYYGPKVHKF